MRLHPTKAGDEPIPGYTLRKRLGAGGYGEVWMADAPGGLHKAVKLVYGAVHETHAASEFKSLQRIRSLTHPFLLSLERIEIVNNQIVIVTELAESSLLDRFELYRRKGDPGIPRAMLLNFIRDTADALDFLSQKHYLQHLDIKPGNLLIVADRIKVGDFGLVKDLHDQNQSLIGGLTPTYSAPEIFDGRPDHRSDQYSLAIVYIEMLTGRLPFSGKTTGELARQHLNQPPDLEALPPADRDVIGRALSKNPLDRYGSCRALADQLQKNRGVLPAFAQVAEDATETEEELSRASTSKSLDTDSVAAAASRTSTAATLGMSHRYQPRIPLENVHRGWKSPHCLFIGVGGMGCQALSNLRQCMVRNADAELAPQEHGWFALDTIADTLCSISDHTLCDPLPAQQILQIPVCGPGTYRKLDPARFSVLSRRWLYNIPKSRTTEGVRPLALLSLLHHYETVWTNLNAEVGNLVKTLEENNPRQQPLRVYVLCSMHGATGGGLLSELGFLLRQIFRQHATSNYRLIAICSAALTANNRQASLPAATALCCLSELGFQMGGGQSLPPLPPSGRSESHHSDRPFDWVTLVDGGLYGKKSDADTAIRRMAKYVLADSQTMLGSLLAEKRTAKETGDGDWLRAACADQITANSRADRASLSRWCLVQALNRTIDFLQGPQQDSKLQKDHVDGGGSSAAPGGELPLTNEACQDFTLRLLKDLGINPSKLADSANIEEQGQIWLRRLLPGQQESQMQVDLEAWKRSLAALINMRMYNWQQIDKIQFEVIQGLLGFCDQLPKAIPETLPPALQTLDLDQPLTALVADYLHRFSERCFDALESFRSQGSQLAKRLERWNTTISAEQAQRPCSPQIDLVTLSPALQSTVKEVVSLLNSVLDRHLGQVLDIAFDPAKGSPPKNAETEIDLRYLISLAAEQVNASAKEFQAELLGPDDQPREDSPDNISFSDLETYYPDVVRHGGRSHRFIVSPVDQLESFEHLLARCRWEKTTTCITSTKSLGALAVCESTGVSVSRLATTLWRPNSATLQLAERLHGRVDIEWPPVSDLLCASRSSHTKEVEHSPLATTDPTFVAELPCPNHSAT